MKNFQNNGTKVQTLQSKNYFKHLFLLLAIAAFGFVGCQDDVIEEIETETVQVESEAVQTESETGTNYFLDGNSVAEGTFDLEDEGLYLHIDRKEENNQEIINIFAFTTRDSYVEWGKDNDYQVEKTFQFEDYAHAYVLENNLLEIYENTNEIPERHINHLNEYKQQLFTETANTDRLFPMVRTDCTPNGNGAGNSFPLISFQPVMPPGFNNTVSNIEYIGIYGVITMYDGIFFNIGTPSLKVTWSGWGFDQICLTGLVPIMDNRMSSCLSIGI